jgi:hypothetical protein
VRFEKLRASRLPVVSRDAQRRILDAQPFLLDGALAAPGAASLLRQTRRLLEAVQPAERPYADGELAGILLRIGGEQHPKTRAGLVPIGPKRMRVWWDGETIPGVRDVLADLSRPKLALRFYDITGLPPGAQSWNHMFDIEIGLDERGRSVDFWSADRTYVVDLGVVYADGRFLTMARTNPAALPREARGAHGSDMVAAIIDRGRRFGVKPFEASAESRIWFEHGGDWPSRDIEAETLLYTLYRAFLDEGPKTLRRLPALAPRDKAVLEREYRARRRVRAVLAPTSVERRHPGLPPRPFIIARLDARSEKAPSPLAYPPATVRNEVRADAPAATAKYWLCALRAALEGAAPRFQRKDVPGVITPMAEKIGKPFAAKAASIHETAANLRSVLSRVPAMPAPVLRQSRRADPPPRIGHAYDVGGAAGRRFGKSGIDFDRMTVLFEGSAEPGARLRVAGQPVTVGADGRFKVECVLTGRKLRIPVEAESSGGGRRQMVRVEWENGGKAVRKGKKAAIP